MVPLMTDTMPVGHQQQHHLGHPQPAGPLDQLEQRAPGQAGLHEVPVAEQHGVGDGAHEGGADEEAGDGQPGRTAGVEARRR